MRAGRRAGACREEGAVCSQRAIISPCTPVSHARRLCSAAVTLRVEHSVPPTVLGVRCAVCVVARCAVCVVARAVLDVQCVLTPHTHTPCPPPVVPRSFLQVGLRH